MRLMRDARNSRDLGGHLFRLEDQGDTILEKHWGPLACGRAALCRADWRGRGGICAEQPGGDLLRCATMPPG